MVVLDTNHVSELFFRSAAGERVLERLLSSQTEAAGRRAMPPVRYRLAAFPCLSLNDSARSR